jgi:hypothetical protein
LVAKVRPREAGPAFVLHIEIQNNNDGRMAWRILRYLCDIGIRHDPLPVRQYLIYIGKEPVSMARGLRVGDLDYRFTFLDMRGIDCGALLAEDNPDAPVLAVLCDFGGREPQAVVNGILLRLRQLVGDDTKRLREYIDMIEILSENRNLKPYIREAERMLTQVDRTRLPSCDLGMEQGLKDGFEKA